MKFPQPVITREHGSWAVLFVPMIIGISYAGNSSVNNLLLALSALGVFMSYVPVHTILRNLNGHPQGKEKMHASFLWATIYLLLGAGFIFPLFLQGFYHLITFAVIGAVSFFGNYLLTIKRQKSIVSDLIAVAGLTVSAPSTYYISTGLLNIDFFLLWLLNFLFFGCSVFYVHMKIKVVSLKKEYVSMTERLTLGRTNILYHVIVISIVTAMVLYNYTPTLSAAAFIPMCVHTVYGTLRLKSTVQFKKLGVLLLAQSILFGMLLVFAWS